MGVASGKIVSRVPCPPFSQTLPTPLVRVHGHGEGATVDFSVIDSNMEFVLASTACCVRHLISGGRGNVYPDTKFLGPWPSTSTGGCGFRNELQFSSDILLE